MNLGLATSQRRAQDRSAWQKWLPSSPSRHLSFVAIHPIINLLIFRLKFPSTLRSSPWGCLFTSMPNLSKILLNTATAILPEIFRLLCIIRFCSLGGYYTNGSPFDFCDNYMWLWGDALHSLKCYSFLIARDFKTLRYH